MDTQEKRVIILHRYACRVKALLLWSVQENLKLSSLVDKAHWINISYNRDAKSAHKNHGYNHASLFEAINTIFKCLQLL